MTTWISITLTLIVASVIIGWGYGFAKGGDYTRHYEADRRVAIGQWTPPAQQVVSERLPPPVVVHVHLTSDPRGQIARPWLDVIEGEIVRELPPARWNN